MTPQELYDVKPEKVRHDFFLLQVFCPEGHVDDIEQETSDEVEIRYLKDHDFDGRRCWTLATVWFRGKPVGIFQEAGREGRDHYERFITDYPLFTELVTYLLSLRVAEKPDDWDVIPVDLDMPELTDFYGYKFVPGDG